MKTGGWAWLKNELTSSDADFNLIMSSIQFLSGEHGFESWGNFPKEVEKMESIIFDIMISKFLLIF